MKHFIFLTQEGLTKAPDNTDVENLQVLGISKGNNKEKAFTNFVKENEYLLHTDFDEVIAMELVGKKQHYFTLKKYD